MKKRGIKLISIVLLVVFLLSCSSCTSIKKRRERFSALSVGSEYIIVNQGEIHVAEKTVMVYDELLKKLSNAGIMRAEGNLSYYGLFFYFDDCIYYRFRIENNTYVYGYWNINNPLEVELLEYSTGRKRDFELGQIGGKQCIFTSTNQTLIYCYLDNWEKHYIDLPADYSIKYVNGYAYFYTDSKRYDAKCVLIDKNMNYVDVPNKLSVNFITEDCGDEYALLSDKNWYALDGMTASTDLDLIERLEKSYELYEKSQYYTDDEEVNHEFVYKGKSYTWYNYYEGSFIKNKTQTTLYITDEESGMEYSFEYKKIAKHAPEIYKIYSALYCKEIIFENDELYFLYWYAGRAYGHLESDVVVFKYNEQVNGLDFIGFTTSDRYSYRIKIYKATA